MRHSRAMTGAIQYSLWYPQLIAASLPPPRSLWTKEASYVGVYLPKTAYILPFFSEYGTGETQGQTLRLDVFIRSLRTGARGSGVIPSWDWIRGGIVFGSLTGSQLRRSNMKKVFAGQPAKSSQSTRWWDEILKDEKEICLMLRALSWHHVFKILYPGLG